MTQLIFKPCLSRLFSVVSLLLWFTAFASASENILDSTIKELLLDKLSDRSTNIEVIYESSYRERYIKEKQNEIAGITLINYHPKTRTFRASITLRDQNLHEEKINLAGKYVAYIEVPVTKRIIKPGEIIQNDDITYVRTKITNLSGKPVLENNNIVGMQATHVLSNGAYIKHGDVRKPPIVEKGDVVTLLYQGRKLKLKTIAITTESGAEGDMIKVKNERSGKLVYGVIKDKHTVMVQDVQE